MDSKCYSLSYEFVCQLLQPVCYQEKNVLPCRDFCAEFLDACGNVLPADLRDRIHCDGLATEADGPGACISKPGTREKSLMFLNGLSVIEYKITMSQIKQSRASCSGVHNYMWSAAVITPNH